MTILIIFFGGYIVLATTGILFKIDVLHFGYFYNSGYFKPIPISVKILQLLKLTSFVLFILGVLYLVKILRLFSNEKHFSIEIFRCFNLSGKLFLFSGILGFILYFVPLLLIEMEAMDVQYLTFIFGYDTMIFYLLLSIVGLFLILFSDIIKKGNIIQSENDLTI